MQLDPFPSYAASYTGKMLKKKIELKSLFSQSSWVWDLRGDVKVPIKDPWVTEQNKSSWSDVKDLL